jgi:hypothetical protein
MKIKQYSIRLGHDYYDGTGFSRVIIKAPVFFPSMKEVRKAYDEISESYGLGLLHDCETVEMDLEI